MEDEAELYWKNEGLLKQKRIQKPSMAQLLSQRFSCEILFNLLSSGEKCIYHHHKDRKYRYYDPFMTAKYKGQDDLELEFRNQVRCFQTCFIDDVENGGFRYPDNLNKQDIIEDIKKWMKFAKMGGRDLLYKTYEKFLSLLEEENKIIVDQIKTTVNYGPDVINKGIFEGVHKSEISNFISCGLKCNKTAFELEDAIKNEYAKEDYSIKAILYHDPLFHEEIEIMRNTNTIKLFEEKRLKNTNNCC